MPALLRVFVANQPMTHVIDAVRALVLDRPAGRETWLTLAWSFGIFAVFAPLVVVAYGRAFAR